MRIEQFQYVVEIAKCRSMSKAAKRLFLSQPSLSAAVSNLEQELGFRIFERSFQGVALTERGERFLFLAEEITSRLTEIQTLAAEKTSPEVRIAAVPVACNALVIELVAQLRDSMPDAAVHIQELRPARVLSALIEGTADLCIGIYAPETQDGIEKLAEQHHIRIEPVFRDALCVFLPGGHPLAGRRSVTRAELAKDTPIFMSDRVLPKTETAQGESTQSTRNFFTFTDQTAMKKAVARGLGYAILPRQMATDDVFIQSGRIAAVELEEEEVQLTIFLAYRRQAALSPAAEKALELLRRMYRQLQREQEQPWHEHDCPDRRPV